MMRKLRWYGLSLAFLLAAGLMFSGPGAPSLLAQAKPIKIGFTMPLTGGLSVGGKAALVAIKIWAEDVNAKGGLLGRQVKLVYYDDHTKSADIPQLYAKLIDVDKVDFVVSSYGSLLIAPAMPTVIERKMVFLSLFGNAMNAPYNYKYYFQIMPAGPRAMVDQFGGFFTVASQVDPKPKTVALVGVDHEFGVKCLEGARETAAKYGFKVIYDERYPPGTTDLTPVARKIKALNPDMVFVASYPPDSVAMVRASKEVGLKPKLFGGGMVGLQFTTIQQTLGPTLNGILNYWFWVPEPTLKFPGIEAFLKKYQARARKEGVDPLGYYLPPWAYAYVQVLGQAIQATKSLDQATVGEYIRANEFDTVVGKVKFAPNGEWARPRTLMVQIQNVKSNDLSEFSKPGKQVVIYPKKFKSGKLIYPFPGWE
ncbi:MAG: amino acid ABC transporter substrate-binding protein [Nitrospinota bacterium]